MLKIEHAAPQDRLMAFGMADACKFKFVNDHADVFRVSMHPNQRTDSCFEALVVVGRARKLGPVVGGLGQIGPSLIAPPEYHTIAVKVVHQLDRPPPLEGSRAVAMVDRWCVFLIDPYPKALRL
jgi:hypothetical protein